MVLSGDIILKHSLWNNVDEDFGNIFKRNVDLFIVACAIGIKEDKIIDNETGMEDDKVKSIGRSTYLMKNEDLANIITFMFQNAVLNSKQIDFDNETRMRLAFDPDFPDAKSKISFSPTNFLVKFATYGLQKIYDLKEENKVDTYFIVALTELLESIGENDYSDVLSEIDREIEEFKKKQA